MTESGIYTLDYGESAAEANRLTYQHAGSLILTKTLLPSSIRSYLSSLTSPLAVADIGTGTGVWLCDLAPELPSDAHLDGYDVDQSKFLSPQDLPPNVKLSFGNILDPFPPELLGKYDLVHVRLLMFALKADQWLPTAANLRTLLKPDGYLMWDETGYPSWTCIPMTQTFQKWIGTDARYAKSVGRDVLSPMALERQLKEAGYIECTHLDFNTFSEPAVYEIGSRAIIRAGRQSLHGIVERGGFEWVQSHEQVEQHFDQLESEVNNGALVGCVVRWTIGRNPEN